MNALPLFLLILLAPLPSRGAGTEKLEAFEVSDLWSTTNSRVENVEVDGEAVLRWRPEAGKSATLEFRPDHPLFSRLRYFDRMELEFRIVSGVFDELELRAMGHVSGARQYKVHQWRLGIVTTAHGVWHTRQLDLSRPTWFVWDELFPDGVSPHFQFGVLAMVPDTVIELRRLRLSSPPFVIKPFFEYPISWPVRTVEADGSTVYAMNVPVLNTSGRTCTIQAALASKHERFKVRVDPLSQEIKNGGTATFTVTAQISKADTKKLPELFSELLKLAISSEEDPETVSTFEMPLTRPLSAGINRQFGLSADDLKSLREKLATGDAEVRKTLKSDELIAEADRFLDIRLDHIPTGNVFASTAPNPEPRFEIGSFMPEIVRPSTGEREVGTPLANLMWKAYLAKIPEKLGMAYAFTGDEKYAAKGVELMELWAKQYRELPLINNWDAQWSQGPALMSASRIGTSSTYQGNMAMRSHMRMLALIGGSDSLTPEARQRIYEGFVLPYATESAKFPGGISNMTDIANHNLLVMGLIFDDANLVRQAVLSDAGLQARLKEIDSDGFTSESRAINYHIASMNEFLPSIYYLKNSGLKIDLPMKSLPAAGRLPYARATLWGVIPNTGDCARGMTASNMALADELLAIFPEETWLQDCGRDSTVVSKIRRLSTGRAPQKDGFRQFLETQPRLFQEAGFAILRSGETPETQIMATLDFGRNIAHAHLDRNQFTLAAFGKIFSHGPGSAYNVGKGGIIFSDDPKLNSFITSGSLSQNVVLVDAQNQMPAIGEMVAWSDKPDNQFATARVKGIAPGVDHTRTLALREGLVLILDRLESAEEHTYDFVYHNFGELSPGAGWTSSPAGHPLAETANYANIIDLKRLSGEGPLHLRWDLTNQVSASAKTPPATTPAHLALWQAPVAGSEIFTGTTGLNNPNTTRMPDVAPSLFTRARGKTASFVTVLEPYKERPSVTGISVESDVLTIQRGEESLHIPLKDFNGAHAR